MYNCEYCKKRYTTNGSLIRHHKICLEKIKYEKDKEISDLKEKLKERENIDFQKDIEEMKYYFQCECKAIREYMTCLNNGFKEKVSLLEDNNSLLENTIDDLRERLIEYIEDNIALRETIISLRDEREANSL